MDGVHIVIRKEKYDLLQERIVNLDADNEDLRRHIINLNARHGRDEKIFVTIGELHQREVDYYRKSNIKAIDLYKDTIKKI